MAKKRGFFAELQREAAQAQRRKQQAASAAARAQATAERQYEAARRQAERAQAQASRASAAEQKAAEREALRLHQEARDAEVEAMNSELATQFQDIDSILASTLEVDDFVDVEQLRKVVSHPAFTRTDLETPRPPPVPLQASPEPQYVEPSPPKGLFGRGKKHAEGIAQAQAAFAEQHAAWQTEVAQLPTAQLRQMQQYQEIEQERLAQLAVVREQYEAECRARETEVEQENAELDDFIGRLASNDEEAVQEYVAMVLGNSVYPECFPVEHEHHFDSALRELSLTVSVPAPNAVPSVKEYKYVKGKDEIVAAALSQREQKDRYAEAVNQVALRTLHEVFEADRDGKIETITARVVTHAINPATGQPEEVDLLAVAVDRSAFVSFDLANVVPVETLRLLKALVSKNPFGLVGIDTSKGVRG